MPPEAFVEFCHRLGQYHEKLVVHGSYGQKDCSIELKWDSRHNTSIVLYKIVIEGTKITIKESNFSVPVHTDDLYRPGSIEDLENIVRNTVARAQDIENQLSDSEETAYSS